MAEVKLILTADNSDYIRKTQQAEKATEKLYNTSNTGAKKQKGLIEDLDAAIQKLEDHKRKALTWEEIEKTNKKLQEAKIHLQEYENAGKKVEQTNKKIQTSSDGIEKSVLRVVGAYVSWLITSE